MSIALHDCLGNDAKINGLSERSQHSQSALHFDRQNCSVFLSEHLLRIIFRVVKCVIVYLPITNNKQ